jgi:hypothetical protein
MNTYVLLWNTYVHKFDRVGRTAKLLFSLSCPPTYIPITVTLRPAVGEKESTSSGRWRLRIQWSAFLRSQKLRQARLVSVGSAEAGTDVGTRIDDGDDEGLLAIAVLLHKNRHNCASKCLGTQRSGRKIGRRLVGGVWGVGRDDDDDDARVLPRNLHVACLLTGCIWTRV